MTVVAHPVDTALVVKDTVIGVRLDVAIMTRIVAAMVAHLHVAAPRLMTIPHLVEAVLRIHIAATTHLLTHMQMAGPLMTDLLQGTTLLETPVMPIMIAEPATGNLPYPKQRPSSQLTLIDTPGSVVRCPYRQRSVGLKWTV
jgi:hypothetical protein